MNEVINEKVSVVSIYDRATGLVKPFKIKWQGRIYKITTLGYHHKTKEGKKLLHIFSVCNETIAFRLKLDTENLHWTLEEVSDGFAS
ncbi:MAG: hypothetical protein V1858_03290 [Candidatus Gottesmanbacteria bacterium]